MSNLNLNWFRRDPEKPATYRCRKHGDIGADVVLLGPNNASAASKPLCHACMREWLEAKFSVRELP